jgi:hypothetical protein
MTRTTTQDDGDGVIRMEMEYQMLMITLPMVLTQCVTKKEIQH